MMEEQKFGQGLTTLFSLDRVHQYEFKPDEIVQGPELHYQPIEDVLFLETPLEVNFEFEDPIDEEAFLQSSLISETTTLRPPVGMSAEMKEGSRTALLSLKVTAHFRTRWNEVERMFVDEPSTAVQQANKLISDVVEMITFLFANELNFLDGLWKNSSNVSTDDLYHALQRYRTFFNWLVE